MPGIRCARLHHQGEAHASRLKLEAGAPKPWPVSRRSPGVFALSDHDFGAMKSGERSGMPRAERPSVGRLRNRAPSRTGRLIVAEITFRDGGLIIDLDAIVAALDLE
jgi:hypothetical protein